MSDQASRSRSKRQAGVRPPGRPRLAVTTGQSERLGYGLRVSSTNTWTVSKRHLRLIDAEACPCGREHEATSAESARSTPRGGLQKLRRSDHQRHVSSHFPLLPNLQDLAHARVRPDGGRLRHRGLPRARRSGRFVRPSGVSDGRPAGRERAREPRPRAERDPQLRVRVSAAPHHRQPGAGGRAQGRLVLRPADRARRARGRRRADSPQRRRSRCCLGELSLDGGIHAARGVLPIAVAARRHRAATRCCCRRRTRRSRASSTGLELCPVRRCAEAVAALNDPVAFRGVAGCRPASRRAAGHGVDGDLADVRGQLLARRALEVAAAGGHNLLMVGPPGAGKTMMARRVGRHPAAADVRRGARVHGRSTPSRDSCRPARGLLAERPFRAPHHTISNVALVGGGPHPRPGEISLAHHGVLFLDEMPEFSRHVLEVLRQPLEEGRVTIARAARTAVFPARFMLVGAMNPCPCGFLGDTVPHLPVHAAAGRALRVPPVRSVARSPRSHRAGGGRPATGPAGRPTRRIVRGDSRPGQRRTLPSTGARRSLERPAPGPGTAGALSTRSRSESADDARAHAVFAERSRLRPCAAGVANHRRLGRYRANRSSAPGRSSAIQR